MPDMNNRLIVNLLLSLASLAVSAVFIAGGSSLLFGNQPPPWMPALGLGAPAYGLLSAALLVVAWFWRGSLLEKFARALVLLFLIIVIYLSTDKSGVAWIDISIAAIMVAINWMAVRRVVSKEKTI